MRRIFTLLTALLFFYASNAQEITISTSADLPISTNIVSSAEGIVNPPSITFERVLQAQWGAITAYRRGREVMIEWATEQENGVDNFAVERSTDARVWYTVAENLPSTNRPYRTQYTQTDAIYYPEQLYYRIKQTCNDSITYSSYAIVAPENSPAQLFIYPNPVSKYFSIAGIDPMTVKLVELYDASGIMVKAWATAQVRYQLPALRPSTYYVRVHTADGAVLDKTIVTQ